MEFSKRGYSSIGRGAEHWRILKKQWRSIEPLKGRSNPKGSFPGIKLQITFEAIGFLWDFSERYKAIDAYEIEDEKFERYEAINASEI